jgi:transposase-like protein
MIKRNRYGVEFKKQVSQEIGLKQSTIAEVSRREGISSTTLSKWVNRYFNGTEKGASISFSKEIEVYEKRIAGLELALGELAYENSLLKKTAEILRETLLRERSSGNILPQSLALKKAVR